ncbi:MAG: hypothetical protein J2P36_17400 [Ktedonobacteraceae bacterium]|nr:hypothetical protein [Ktedonobacteraceae bacterium]
MSTPRLTTEMQQLIAHAKLGSPLEIYSPLPIGPTILLGIVMFGFVACIGVSVLTGSRVHFTTDIWGGITMIEDALLFSVLGVVPACIMIMVAFSNRKKRAVICTFGVAFFLHEGFGSFRWKDVLTTTRQSGSKRSLTYTVYCHDGRRIVFNGLTGMYMLAEAIDVQVAHAHHS